eukprot:CAMPEP_0173388372 /NCGR_PEP_ID=MMETSP1356-20130122/10696_1 /TAXON_ID=77927 ORGANISM="Hemiselmis virescens, Strain PCC157" /NCGR_SAMPLE_ID=MMETSP1356 /ASSEMBLY_ACC=CAM_ASM_000847 /LENGTH=439 /DNA_ID=CAMNT_0014345263 /DNA_START=48 /DNA_END=1367 /DNA_ORIENTATION=-
MERKKRQREMETLKKKRQREVEVVKKERLAQLVEILLPGKRKAESKAAPSRKKRNAIGMTGLLEDVIECLKVPKGAARVKEKWHYRTGMLLSRYSGSMLVMKEDHLRVLESNLGMELFVPFEAVRGYRGQSLNVMSHPEDADELVAVVQRAEVGRTVSVRLLRLCFDEATRCLMSQYVRKELTVSHVSSDGKSVLLTCSLSDKDRGPIATSPKYFEDFFREFETRRGPCRIVSAGSPHDVMQWLDERIGCAGNEDQRETSFLKRLFEISQGYAESIALALEDCVNLYPWVGRDRLGRPVFQLASRLQHEGYETAWLPFMLLGFSGKQTRLPSMVSGEMISLLSTLLMPEEGTVGMRTISTMMIILKNGVVEGRFSYEYNDDHFENRGYMLRAGGKVSKRHAFMVPTAGCIPSVEQTLGGLAANGVEKFFVPYSPKGGSG